MGQGQGRVAGHLALVAVQLCFGFFPLLGKWALEGATPRQIAAWRLISGAVFIGGGALIARGKHALPGLGDLFLLQLCAFFGVVLNMTLSIEGLDRSTAIHAGLLFGMIPVITFLIAILVRQERFAWPPAIGITIALTGTAVLFLADADVADARVSGGDALIVVQVVLYSCYLVLSKRLIRAYGALVVLAWVFLLSSWTIPFVLDGQSLVPSDASSRALWSLVWLMVFPTVIAYMLNLFALSKLRASTTAAYVFLQPLLATVTGVRVLDEKLSSATVIAAIAILAGLGCVVYRKPSGLSRARRSESR